MDTHQLEHRLHRHEKVIRKIKDLLPELQAIPATPREFCPSSIGFTIYCDWADFRAIRRHFCRGRLRPVGRYKSKDNQSYWINYELDGAIWLALNVSAANQEQDHA